ncbi:chaoptin-like isoform X2 [Onthophagus taurus]
MKCFIGRMQFGKITWLWVLHIIYQINLCNTMSTSGCSFNSMCLCSSDQHDLNGRFITDVSCISIPLYKFPNLPEGNIKQLEIMGSRIPALESESLAGCQVQSLSLPNNHLQHVADRTFSSTSKSLKSLDLSYNELDVVPFQAFRELKNLQWINLHGNQIQEINGDWSHLKNTTINLFLGENDIKEIPSEKLHQFKSLIWLNLDGNRISKIKIHSLPHTLQTLSLSNNLIEEFPQDTISSLIQLQWLYLRGNHIKTIPETSSIKKLWLEKIDLRENLLTKIPKKPFNNTIFVRDLNLSFNTIKTLINESFYGLNCGRIIISYNEIEKIEKYAFKGVENTLEFLDFDHNNLIDFPEEALKRLNALKYLYVSSNFLKEIKKDALKGFCSNVKALSFSGNQFEIIPSNALKDCVKITHFNMAYNRIEVLKQNDFINWGENIKNLILTNNQIHVLKKDVFIGLKDLKELSLSFNPIKYIDENAFNGLKNLENLELSFSLESIKIFGGMFKPIFNLKFLSIDNNNLENLDENLFDFLPNLRYINCEFNRLKLIHPNLFKKGLHTKLKEIRFSNNEIEIVFNKTFEDLPNLEKIILSFNKIKEIQNEAFSDLTNLKSVILMNNLIYKIDLKSFNNLPNLELLNLFFNHLNDFSFNFVSSNQSQLINLNLSLNKISICNSNSRLIETLDLNQNNLKEIPKCLLKNIYLKKLLLNSNLISILNQNDFLSLTLLEILSLKENVIKHLHRYSFFGLNNLQILDLSKNFISTIHLNQFLFTPKLRVLNLSSNNLSYLPRDVFIKTLLEKLDLSQNFFSVIPNLIEIAPTLRDFSINSNEIEHISSTTFSDLIHLNSLDLSDNKFNILPDNVFTGLGLLQKLVLELTSIRANFKELFHYAQNLKELILSKSNVIITPTLPLPNLIYLNLSFNLINHLGTNTFRDLFKLLNLDLSNNLITHIQLKIWSHLPQLKKLNLSNNPIKQINSDSFHQLKNLQSLDIQGLNKLEKFDGKSIEKLEILHTLSIETSLKIDNFKKQLCKILSKLRSLRILKLKIRENVLNDQLRCISNTKIRELEISGENLKMIHQRAFEKFTRNNELVLKISNTSVEDLPPGLFSNMYKIPYLSIDLRGNMLTFLNTDIFYGNSTTWKNVGTTLVSGGLQISYNPFKCGCHLAWLSYWLRRWMRESLLSHNAPMENALIMNEALMETTCMDENSGKEIPIVQILPEDSSCHASALSVATKNFKKVSVISIILYLTILIVINNFCITIL